MIAKKSYPVLAVGKPEFMKVSSINFIENERMCNYVQRGGEHEIPKTRPAELGVKKSDYVKNKTIQFLENERTGNIVDTQETTFADVEHKHVLSSNSAHVEEQPVYNRSEMMEAYTTETRVESGTYAPKRFTTTCYFKPKQNPVSYSETVILVLGSKKKHYFDTVLYQTKLVPFRWTETLTTIIKPSEQEVFQTEHQSFMDEPQYHYMSLEPQQIAASEKLQTPVYA